MEVHQIYAHNVKIAAKVVACQIRGEGMKAENSNRERRGEAQAYDEGAFEELATEVDRLSESFVDG